MIIEGGLQYRVVELQSALFIKKDGHCYPHVVVTDVIGFDASFELPVLKSW